MSGGAKLKPDAGHLVATTDIPQWRDCLATFRYGQGAAGVETAASRWVQWTGHLPFEDDSLTLLLYEGVSYGHRRKQRLGIGVQRILIEHL